MLPNFLVAGVAKAGTTSLYYYLTQHPEVDIPRKETFYFAKEFYKNAPGDKPPYYRDKSRIVFTKEDYDKFYSQCHKKAIGEVSTCYAYFYESAIPLIKEKLGDIKIIFILRNPVERTFSAYKHFLRTGSEKLSFKEALAAEKSRKEKHWDFMWYYADVGFYAKQVKAFKNNFSQVKVFLNEDLVANSNQVMKEIFQFIGVNDQFIPDTNFRYNTADSKPVPLINYLSKKSFAGKFIKSIVKKIIPEKKRMAMKQKSRIEVESPVLLMNADVKEKLLQLYHDDNLELEKIIEKDLRGWRK